MLGVQFYKGKKIKLDLPNEPELRSAGAILWDTIMRRVQVRQLDSDGKPLPQLREGGRKLWVEVNDPRFPTGGTPSWRTRTIVNGKAVWGWVPEADRKPGAEQMKWYASYGQAKSAVGARPIGDGRLTGGLWKSRTVGIRPVSDGAVLRWYFKGKSQTAGHRVTPKGKVKPEMVDNYLKGAAFLSRQPDGKRTWQGPAGPDRRRKFQKAFEAFTPSRDEWRMFMAIYKRGVRLTAT